jgi:hypothetical protein
MQTLDTFKRKLLVRTCSVCGVEIDKTTAYTVSGEQKAQGRRCINCIEGAAPKAKATSAEKASAEPTVAQEAPKAPVAENAPVSQPQPTAPAASQATDSDETESSTVKYVVGAVIVAVIIWLVLD